MFWWRGNPISMAGQGLSLYRGGEEIEALIGDLMRTS